jgi:hypothetical protein
MAGGFEELSAALDNAKTNPSPIVMMGRMSLLINFLAAYLTHVEHA